MQSITKKCAKCRLEKPAGEFYRQTKARDGRQAWCKDCAIKRQSETRTQERMERDARRKPYRRDCGQWVVPLTRGLVALIDEVDVDELSKYNWHVSGREGGSYTPYARAGDGQGGHVSMHRMIAKCPPDKHVDHINGDGLDNRRRNLRTCYNKDNIRNSRGKRGSSRYKGVYWDKRREKWEAQIRVDRRRIHLGRFDNEEQAAKAYDEAARKHFGEFANLNLAP